MNGRNPRITTVLLARHTTALKRHLRSAAKGDPKGIHQARVASRRLREAVPVLAAGVKGKNARKARREVRRLTELLGGLRELDVTVHLLDELGADGVLPRTALEDVRASIVKECDRRRALVVEHLADAAVTKLTRRLARVTEALADGNPGAWRPRLGARLLKRAKTLGTAMEAAGHVYAPEHLHAVRIAVKKLRYALELAADAEVAGAAAHVRALKRVQGVLGRLHDLQVLQSRVADVEGGQDSRLARASGLPVVARALEDECRHLHARYVSAIPGLAAVAEDTKKGLVPRIAQRGSGGRHTVKMPLDQRKVALARAQRAAGGRN